MKAILHYIKPHVAHTWTNARSFSLIRRRMATPWQTWQLFWNVRKVVMINTPGWLPVVIAYRYFVSMFHQSGNDRCEKRHARAVEKEKTRSMIFQGAQAPFCFRKKMPFPTS